MKTKNKILIILASFILLLLLLNSKVFAAEETIELPVLPEATQVFLKDKYYVIVDRHDFIFYYICEQPLIYTADCFDSDILDGFLYPSASYCKSWDFSYKVATSTFLGLENDLPTEHTITSQYNVIDDIGYVNVNTGKYNILQANYDVYNFKFKKDSSNRYILDTSTKELVFQAPPQGLEAVLEEGYQTAQVITTQSITQQLGVLVPVGIVIMATIILVFLIKSFHFWRP